MKLHNFIFLIALHTVPLLSMQPNSANNKTSAIKTIKTVPMYFEFPGGRPVTPEKKSLLPSPRKSEIFPH